MSARLDSPLQLKNLLPMLREQYGVRSAGCAYLDYVRDMLENAQKTLLFVRGMTRPEVIGEVARMGPKAIRKMYPEISWREITGTRDKLIHEYFWGTCAVIWRNLQANLPPSHGGSVAGIAGGF